jgi:hypothetical protein
MTIRYPVASIKDLLTVMKAGAVLTREGVRSPGTFAVSDEDVLRKDGECIELCGSVINRALRSGKIRSVKGSDPLQYEIAPDNE